MALADAKYVELEPYTAHVIEETCSGCKTCLSIFPYSAITFVTETKTARVNEVLCKGCGTCVATCPSGSLEQNLFEDQEIFEEVEGLLAYA
jgi:heterodisulfide reductase subunit A